MDIKGMKVLVTGATGGIGEVLCDYLASQGCNLLLTARNEESLKNSCNLLKERYQIDADWHVCDFGAPDSIDRFLLWLQGVTKELHGLVVMPPQIAATTDSLPEDETWRKIFDVSFIGPLRLIRGVLPLLGRGQRAKVVIISGISSVHVLSHYATSNVLRNAWRAQAKTLADAFGPKNIHFNTLSLGGVLTEKYKRRLMNKAHDNQRSFEAQMLEEVSNVPLRKYATPLEVARAVGGLLSPFSDHMTGMNILLDGGFNRGY